MFGIAPRTTPPDCESKNTMNTGLIAKAPRLSNTNYNTFAPAASCKNPVSIDSTGNALTKSHSQDKRAVGLAPLIHLQPPCLCPGLLTTRLAAIPSLLSSSPPILRCP